MFPITGNPTHHYFVVDPVSFMPILTDPDGTILVFTDRDVAVREGHARLGQNATIAVIGMGNEKWAMFQREEKFRVVKGGKAPE
jgi:hypothetical protein